MEINQKRETVTNVILILLICFVISATCLVYVTDGNFKSEPVMEDALVYADDIVIDEPVYEGEIYVIELPLFSSPSVVKLEDNMNLSTDGYGNVSYEKVITESKNTEKTKKSNNKWKWPTKSHKVSSSYGYRYGKMHTGLDIYGSYGDPIYASKDGVITKAGWYGTYGLFIGINHNNGYGTGYGHLSKFAKGIKVGTKVKKGQIIGYVGNTGNSKGVHLHFEIYKGKNHPGYSYNKFINPINIF